MCINPYITVNLKDVIIFHQKMNTSTINLKKWTQFFIRIENMTWIVTLPIHFIWDCPWHEILLESAKMVLKTLNLCWKVESSSRFSATDCSASEIIRYDIFRCVICLEILIEPVVLPCGHEFCASCFEPHLEGKDVNCFMNFLKKFGYWWYRKHLVIYPYQGL